jgi:hypothetical protein
MNPTDASALPTQPTPDANLIQQGATTSSVVPFLNQSPIVSAQIRDKSKGRAVRDVTDWLKGEGFEKGILDKFTGESFSFAFNIPQLHMRFIANAVQGKVLMALHHFILKCEIGIVP